MQLGGTKYLIVLALAVGCGGRDGSTTVDAGAGDGSASGELVVAPPEAPAPPALPQLTPCPAGWVEARDSEEAPAVCLPWADDDLSCGEWEVRWPGTVHCAPVGRACPAGTWPDVEASRVLHVESGRTAGDGSRAAPFGTLEAALAVALPGTTVVLARGVYEELVTIPTGVTLRGACAAETVIRGTEPADGVVLFTDGRDVRVEDVRIEGDGVGILPTDGSAVELSGVIISGTVLIALGAVNGGTVTGREVLVRGTRPRADGLFGRGLEAESGGRIELERAWVETNYDVGVFAENAGSRISLRDSVVRDVIRVTGARTALRGVHAQSGAAIALERALVEETRDLGITANGMGTTMTLTDVVVRRTRGNEANGRDGAGVVAEVGASLVADRLFVDDNHLIGLTSIQANATVRDLVVTDTAPQTLGSTFGVGITVSHAGTATIERAWLARNHAYGAGAIGGDLTLRDVTIVDTQPDGALGLGRGLELEEAGRMTVERARIARGIDAAIYADGAGSELTATDVHIEHMASHGVSGRGGMGVSVSTAAQATFTRLAVDDCREAGIVAFDPGTRLTLVDTSVRNTLGRALDGQTGRGLIATTGAYVHASRLVLEGNTGLGAAGYYGEAELVLEDLLVRDTQPAECIATGCTDGIGGIGLGAYGARVEVSRFRIEDNALAAGQVAADGCIDLRSGTVARNTIGINVQVTGYDYEKVLSDVLYRDNQANIASLDLPVPAPPDLRL